MADVPKLVKRTGARVAPKLVDIPEVRQFVSGGRDADIWWTGGTPNREINVGATGIDRIMAILKNMGPAARAAAGYEMAEFAHEVIQLSKDQFVPRDTMALYDSANADEYDPATNADITQIGLWYAAPGYVNTGSDTSFVTATDQHGKVLGTYRQSTGHGGGMVLKKPEEYALAQHENMEYKHPWGGPKYLERPLIQKAPELFPRLAAAIRNCWGVDTGVLDRSIGSDADVYLGTFGPKLGV